MNGRYKQARSMRRRLTPPEYLLWTRLKTRQPHGPIFRRQHVIEPYIADFYCVRARLVVEVDGSHHSDPDRIRKDAIRDEWMMAQGIEVYRLSAAYVLASVDEAADGVGLLAMERLEMFRRD